MESKLKICIIGASGLVGHQLHKLLSQNENIEHIIAVTRKSLSEILPKTSNLVIDFSNLSSMSVEADVYICCLGTTIKDAGSPAAFRLVDYDYVLQFAELAKKNHARKFLLISALGADAHSKIFYNQIKGQVEAEVCRLKIPVIDIFRPSLLLGDRTQVRPGELLAQKISPLINPILIGPLQKYRAIQSKTVALAMQRRVFDLSAGRNIFESNEIEKLAK